MTMEQKIIKSKLGLLKLARHLGNVSQAWAREIGVRHANVHTVTAIIPQILFLGKSHS